MFKKQNNNRPRTNYRSVNTNFRTGNAAPSSSQLNSRAKAELKTARQEKVLSKMGRHKKILRLYAVAAVGMLGLFVFSFTISSVSVKSPSSVPDDLNNEYGEVFKEAVSKNSFLNQSWSLSEAGLKNDVFSKYPEVNKIDLKIINPISRTMQANLQYRKPVFLWQDASRQQRYVDEAGVLFSKNFTDVKAEDLILIKDDSGLVLDSGNTAVGQVTARIIGELPSKTSDIKLVGTTKTGIERVEIPKSTRELRIYFKGTKYFAKISTSRGVDEQVGDLNNLMKYLASKKIIPSSYVDLRLEGKVFYK